MHLAFEKLNSLSDGMLKYSEFSEAMMPLDQHYARLLGTKKLQFISRAGMCPFDNATMAKYLQLWELIIHNEKAIESVRQKIAKRGRFDLLQAFQQCDFNRDEAITLSEVSEIAFHSCV